MPKSVDQRPGVLPDIAAVGESIVYTFTIAGTRGPEHVTIRCDAFGQLWIAVVPKQA